MAFDGVFGAIQALIMPSMQAAATILILKHQKKQYDAIAEDRIRLIEEAVQNYCDSIDACVASGVFREAFGSVPDAILYNPVDITEEHKNLIEDNLSTVPAANRHMTAVNRLVENNDLARLVNIDPKTLCNLNMQSCQIKDLMAGKLPVDDVVEVLTDTAEQACMLGRIGNTKGTTMRNLGISRIRAQAAGRAAFERHNAMLNRDVSPIARQTHIGELLQTPQQRVALALTQNQLIQQSLQNAANADAAGDPTVFAELQTKLQKINNRLGMEAQRGNMINQFVPNYAALLQPAINSLTESLKWGNDGSTLTPEEQVTKSSTPAPSGSNPHGYVPNVGFTKPKN